MSFLSVSVNLLQDAYIIFQKSADNFEIVHKTFRFEVQFPLNIIKIIDIEYNKRLDRQRPCLEGDLTAGSNL